MNIEKIEWFRPEDNKPDNKAKVILCYDKDNGEFDFAKGIYKAKRRGFGESWGGDAGGSWSEPDYWAEIKGPKKALKRNKTKKQSQEEKELEQLRTLIKKYPDEV